MVNLLRKYKRTPNQFPIDRCKNWNRQPSRLWALGRIVLGLLLLATVTPPAFPKSRGELASPWVYFDALPSLFFQTECRLVPNGAEWTLRVWNKYNWQVTFVSSGPGFQTQEIAVIRHKQTEWDGLASSTCDGAANGIQLNLQVLWNGGDFHVFYANGSWLINRDIDYATIRSIAAISDYTPGSWPTPDYELQHQSGWKDAVSGILQGIAQSGGGAPPPPLPANSRDDADTETDPNPGQTSYSLHNECISHRQRGDTMILSNVCNVPITVASCRKDASGDCTCQDESRISPGQEAGRWILNGAQTVLWKAAFSSEVSGVPASLFPACRMTGAR